MAFSLLALVNAGLYAVQLVVNHQFSRDIGPISRRHETLITPAPYAFAIWGVIYLLLTLTVVVDCCYPSVSIFTRSNHPTALRLLFSVTCIANAAWVFCFTNDYINVSTGILAVLWLALGALYLFIVLDRHQRPSFEYCRFFLSELGLTVYLAWTCAATLISIAVTAQDITQSVLPVSTYLSFVTILVALSITAVVYAGDIPFGLVAVWALTGIANKQLQLEEPTQSESLIVRASAAQGASLITAFIVISIVHRCCARHSIHARYQLATESTSAPILNDKGSYVNYGTTPPTRFERSDPHHNNTTQSEEVNVIAMEAEAEGSHPSTTAGPTRPRLCWINAALFALQLILTALGFARDSTFDQRYLVTPITPAAYAFEIWTAIYLATAVMALTDCFYPQYSVFSYASRPDILRWCFAATCVVNTAWVWLFTTNHVHIAALDIIVLWWLLLPIYVFLSWERQLRPFLWRPYLCSELCFRLYFSWISAAVVVSVAISMQVAVDGFLSLATYLSLLGSFLVLAVSAVAYCRDPVIGLVAAWALVGITQQSFAFPSTIETSVAQVQACAALGAGVLISTVAISLIVPAISPSWYDLVLGSVILVTDLPLRQQCALLRANAFQALASSFYLPTTKLRHHRRLRRAVVNVTRARISSWDRLVMHDF
ncbi:TPA: hypothetical protein N0F65_011070 [Lagenidium giganteum]|uniref:Transmembrane protein n=1 Tax=Lagenidium giganteum TaxID=4803 RepID=A0AAV2ZCQ5_9STRA|nr:TPA: hypothetical protein N0F65_011070 [Lagenidium giganteum]